MIKDIDSVILFVNNLKTQMEFYETKLRLKKQFSNDSMSQYQFNSSVTFILHQTRSEHDFSNKGNIHFNFKVENLASFVKELEKNNVNIIDHPNNKGFGYMVATILDSEGNKIDLLEPITSK